MKNLQNFSASRCIAWSYFLLLAMSDCIQAGSPDGYAIPSSTYSPNGRLGVKLPVFHSDPDELNDPRRNQVVEISSRRVVTIIQADVGYDRRLNHREVAPPKWSADSSTLLWKVEGKWFPTALVLLKFKDGKELWQLDLLKRGQKEILSRTQKANPEQYAAAKEENSENGSAYPDGFTVDIKTDQEEGTSPISLPMKVQVTLTSNPKQIEDFPANLDATLEATVTEKGEFLVKDFQLNREEL